MLWVSPILLCVVGTYGLPNPVPFSQLGPRIINGDNAASGQFPWQAAIYVTFSGYPNLCGGALISDSWILTAAHCVDNGTNIRVALGSITLEGDDAGRLNLDAEGYIAHEGWDSSTIANDIAVISLSEPIEFTDDIQPIALADSDPDAGTTVTVSGWGVTNDTVPAASPDLKFVDLVTISESDCTEAFSGFHNDGTLCAVTKTDLPQGVCEGDSGGPLVVIDDSNGATHVGVVSFGGYLCEGGQPSGFSSTSYFREWIREKTGV